MPIFELLDSYELRIAGEGRTAVVAELWHVRRNSAGGSVNMPIGYVAAAPRPAAPEEAAHWQADLLLRSDEPIASLIDARLPTAIADWLVRDTSATEPLLVNIFRGRNTEYVMRGRITDDD